MLSRFRSLPLRNLCQQNLQRSCSSITAAAAAQASSMTAAEHGVQDQLQELALKENCILVDSNDKAIGSTTKADCHRVDAATGEVKLHRAFSVFLFNSLGEMLVQRRSVHKITFPNRYTNACCSHPLHDIELEQDEVDAMGVRRAAQRRLNYELGIPSSQIELDDFHYLTRVHYANSGDGIWGEHEIDYILFLQKDVDIQPNSNEVSEVRYIKRGDIDYTVANFKAPLTPWFKLVLDNQLKQWWDNLHQLQKFEDHKNIQRLS